MENQGSRLDVATTSFWDVVTLTSTCLVDNEERPPQKPLDIHTRIVISRSRAGSSMLKAAPFSPEDVRIMQAAHGDSVVKIARGAAAREPGR
jgi:hypothetical protein